MCINPFFHMIRYFWLLRWLAGILRWLLLLPGELLGPFHLGQALLDRGRCSRIDGRFSLTLFDRLGLYSIRHFRVRHGRRQHRRPVIVAWTSDSVLFSK